MKSWKRLGKLLRVSWSILETSGGFRESWTHFLEVVGRPGSALEGFSDDVRGS